MASVPSIALAQRIIQIALPVGRTNVLAFVIADLKRRDEVFMMSRVNVHIVLPQPNRNDGLKVKNGLLPMPVEPIARRVIIFFVNLKGMAIMQSWLKMRMMLMRPHFPG